MKRLFLILLLFVPLVANADTQQAHLTAVEPVENTDGSALTDLAGINVYHYRQGAGPDSITVINYPASAATGGGAFVADIAAGNSFTQMFYVTAVTTDGRESEPSAIGSKTFANSAVPNAPTDFVVQ